MTREEIVKEAQEQVNYCTPLYPECFIQGYLAGAEPRENKIADIKANCDLAIEGKDLEIKELKMTDEYIIKTLESKVEKLQEDLRNKRISIKNKKAEIKELELELTVEKDQHQEEINLHLHAEDYIKSLEQENNRLLDVINGQDVKIADLEKENKILEGYLLAEQEHTQMLEQQIEKMKEVIGELIAITDKEICKECDCGIHCSECNVNHAQTYANHFLNGELKETEK